MTTTPQRIRILTWMAIAASAIWVGTWVARHVNQPAGESPGTQTLASTPAARRVVSKRPDDSVTIDRRLLGSVRYLASDELEGRGVGTKGLDLAADYIANQFRAIGLRTDLCNGSHFQIVRSTSRLGLTGNNCLELVGPESLRRLEMKIDFQPLSLSASGEFDLPVAFVGHGITTDKYDDYADVDVADKAVILMRNMPRHNPAEFPSSDNVISPHAYISQKVANAISHGAAAVILCTNRDKLLSADTPGSTGRPSNHERLNKINRHDSLLEFNVAAGEQGRRIPVLHVRRAAIDDMLRGEVRGTNLLALEDAIDRDRQPHSFILEDCKIRGTCSVEKVITKLKNVVAALEGSGEFRNETVVVGAHYDHLGYGGGWGSLAPWTREIHNGADDNASGTAVMIEVAHQLASRKETMRRRVLFVAFTAEESGLVGSEYFVRHSPVPLTQLVAMINLDMVGYLRDQRLTISGTGTAREFPSLLDELASQHQLQVLMDPSGYGPSDHASFHSYGVPVLHLFTGFHENYHRPSDDTEKLNIAGMRRITEFTTAIVARLANAPLRPSRRPSRRGIVISDLHSEKPGLGVKGDRSFTGSGLRVRSVIKRSPAERVGIRAGDVVTKINGALVANFDDFESAIAKLRTDSPVRMTVQRSSGSFEFQVR